jgi:aminocarboxymuconate-semialdehyde decarboxylase
VTTLATDRSVAAAPDVRRGVIDVHAHWLPQELFDLPPGSPVPPLNARGEELHLGDIPLSIAASAMSDPDRVLAETDRAGLGARVLSAPPFAFPVVADPGVGEYVGRFNEALTRLCHDSGGRLLGLGLVSLHDPTAAQAEMEAIAASSVVRGVAVPPLIGATSFDEGPLHEIARLAAELDLAVLVHPMQLPRPEWKSYYLANLIGNPTETATAVASCVLGGVMEKLPSLRICFVHGGGCAPALLGRWRHGWEQRADASAGTDRTPHEGFRDLWFDTLTHDGPALQLLRSKADPDRLMCGSDYPFDMGVDRPQDLPLSEGVGAEAMEAGARRFLDLPELGSDDDA